MYVYQVIHTEPRQQILKLIKQVLNLGKVGTFVNQCSTLGQVKKDEVNKNRDSKANKNQNGKQNYRQKLKEIPLVRRNELQRAIAISGPFIKNEHKLEHFTDLLRSYGQITGIEKKPSRTEISIAKLPDRNFIFVIFAKVNQALKAVMNLNGKQFGELLAYNKNKVQKSQDQKSYDVQPIYARQVYGEGAHMKKLRLIIKNLPFKVNEKELRSFICAKQYVWDLYLPKKGNKNQGYAFVTYISKAHMLQALSQLNQKVFQDRKLEVDILKPRDEYTQQASLQQQQAKQAQFNELKGKYGDQIQDYIEQDLNSEQSSDRNVDTQDDNQHLETKRKIAVEQGNKHVNEKSNIKILNNTGKMPNHRIMGEDKTLQGKGVNIVNLDEEVEKELKIFERLQNYQKSQIDSLENKKNTNNADCKSTRLIKQQQQFNQNQNQNLSKVEYDSSKMNKHLQKEQFKEEKIQPQDIVQDRVKQYQQTLDMQKERQKNKLQEQNIDNTVFIRNLQLDVDQYELKERLEQYGKVKSARIAKNKTTGHSKGTAFVEFQDQKSAKNIVEQSQNALKGEHQAITFRGQSVRIDMAVPTDKARQMAINLQKNEDSNKNKQLLKEGYINEDSWAWKDMSSSDRMVRKRAAQEKNTMLKSPNFSVSNTRLLIRNIPKHFQEKDLKEICIQAVKERATKALPQILQAKLLREKYIGIRKKELQNVEHKGRGFIEFLKPDHALTCLRQLNNNPKTSFGKEKRPIVEFALQKVQVIRTLNERKSELLKNKKQKLSEKRQKKKLRQKSTGIQEAQEQNDLGKNDPSHGQINSEVQIQQDGQNQSSQKSKIKYRQSKQDVSIQDNQVQSYKQQQQGSQQINSRANKRNQNNIQANTQQAKKRQKVQQDTDKNQSSFTNQVQQQDNALNSNGINKRRENMRGPKLKDQKMKSNAQVVKMQQGLINKKQQKEKKDKFDNLVESYTNKLFGPENDKRQVVINKRWYD